MRRALSILSGIIILITTAAAYAGDCGDVNDDTKVNVGDAVYLINYIFKGGPAPVCGPETGNCGDVSGDIRVNVGDAVYLINYIFKGGPAPSCGPETGTMIDVDGNIYQTVKIGTQWWMAENLKVTHYRNIDPIPNVTDNTAWAALTTGAYCSSSNNDTRVATYGRLYNWFAVSDSRDIAPAGWHIPSDTELQILIDYLGGGAIAGGKMKEKGTVHWVSPNTDATNESGFSALPGGLRTGLGYFAGPGYHALFWFITEYDSDNAWSVELAYDFSNALPEYDPKTCGFSVRCVKD